jgi:hypothetical protein
MSKRKITALSQADLADWEEDSEPPSTLELLRYSMLLASAFKMPGRNVIANPEIFLQLQRATLARRGFSKRALVHAFWAAHGAEEWLPETAPLVRWCEDALGEADWLLDAIVDELQHRRLPVPTRSALKALSQYRTYARDSKSVRAWLERSAKLEPSQRGDFGRTVVRAYFGHLERWSNPPPISVGTALVFIRHLPEAVEAGFPGYADRGLLPVLAQRRSDSRHHFEDEEDESRESGRVNHRSRHTPVRRPWVRRGESE